MQWIGSVDGISQSNVLAMKLDSNGEKKNTVQTFQDSVTLKRNKNTYNLVEHLMTNGKRIKIKENNEFCRISAIFKF